MNAYKKARERCQNQYAEAGSGAGQPGGQSPIFVYVALYEGLDGCGDGGAPSPANTPVNRRYCHKF